MDECRRIVGDIVVLNSEQYLPACPVLRLDKHLPAWVLWLGVTVIGKVLHGRYLR